MSDHPICRGQFQLHIHFHHRYVALLPVRAAPTPEPACAHRNQTLLTVDISSSSRLMLNTFHVFVSQPARVVLSLFHALISFPFPCRSPAPPFLDLIPLTRLTEGPPTLIPIFFTISAFPEEELTSLACIFIPLLTLLSVSQGKKTSGKAGQATFCILIWVLCGKNLCRRWNKWPQIMSETWKVWSNLICFLSMCLLPVVHTYFLLWKWMNVTLLWYSQNWRVFIIILPCSWS